MAIFDFQVGGYPLCLHQVCQGEYVLLNYIHFDGGEWKIFHNCVGGLGGGESEKLKKEVDSTVP